MILDKLKGFLKNHLSFSRESAVSVVTLIGGTTLSQIITIGATPVLSRLYTPADFGVMGVFLAVAVIAISLSSLQYSKAILLPSRYSYAFNLLIMCFLILAGISILSGLFVFIAGGLIVEMYDYPNLSSWLHYLPVYVLLAGMKELMFVWSNRQKAYKRIATGRVLSGITTMSVSIALGVMLTSSLGLLYGLISGQIVVLGYLFFKFFKDDKLAVISSRIMKYLALKYRNFPLYSLPAELLDVFVLQIPVFALGLYSSSAAVGYYEMSNRVLGLPLSFIGGAVSEVFRQKSSEIYNREGRCDDLFLITLKYLIIISIVPLIFLITFAPSLFAFVLGPEWRQAGVYTQLLASLFLFRFIASPLSFLYHVAARQKEELLISIYMLISSGVIFYNYASINVLFSLSLYSINSIVIYLIIIRRSYVFSRNTQ